MAAIYYNTDAQITDLLPTLTGSVIADSGDRDTKLRIPARDWVNSVYPSLAPFPDIAAAGEEWLVNQADHAAGDTTVTIDGGTNVPVVDDWFRVEFQNTWYKASAYGSNIVTFASGPPDWAGAALDNFPDNARLLFGTPALLQLAATWYCVHLGYQFLRQNPVDEAAASALMRARSLLQIPEGSSIAMAQPFPSTKWADDYRDYNDFQPGHATLLR